MQLLESQIDAPINPNEGLGGFRLRTPIGDLQDSIMWGKVSYELLSFFEARYTFDDGEIAVGVDIRNGKIFKIMAYQGYRGKLFGKIRVGMLIKEAMELEPRLYYDEAEEVIFCRDVPGLVIDVPEIDPPPELVPGMAIKAIVVNAPEAFTSAGQRGNW